MKTGTYSIFGAVLITLAACVTINVYFPEAAAQEAADRFIEDVIGPETKPATSSQLPAPAKEQNGFQQVALQMALGMVKGVANLVLPAAHAQVNIDINTPEIRAIQARMAGRFDAELSAHFASGAIGLTNDAKVAVRDLSSVGLRDRSGLNAAVAADNRDRDAVYREIAVANGQPEWEGQIRQTFAQQWISNARAGWYYQNSAGNWQQK